MNKLLRLLLAFSISFMALGARAEAAPHGVLRNATDDMFAVLHAHRAALHTDPQALYGLVEKTLSPHVDFPLISQLVLGKHWRTADAAQRVRFMTEFRTLLVRFYVGALLEDPRKLDELLDFSDTLIQFRPAEPEEDARKALVRAEVHLPSGRVVLVSFNLRRKDETWKVYDVTVEGVSLVTNYRSSFASEVRQGGLDALIDRLAARNRALLNQGSARAG
ncbi:MAG: phospholipid-binding protein MlaC [Thiohalomonadaceae bacterium]